MKFLSVPLAMLVVAVSDATWLVAANEAPQKVDKVFDPTSLFGLLGPLFIVIAALAYAWGQRKSQGEKGWRSAAEAAELRATENAALAAERDARIDEYKRRTDEMIATIANERNKTDLTPLMEKFLEHSAGVAERHQLMLQQMVTAADEGNQRFAKAMEALSEHDKRVAERHFAMMEDLKEITAHLVELNGRK